MYIKKRNINNFYIFLFFAFFIFSCEPSNSYKPATANLNDHCTYDTDCKDNYYCNKEFKVCSKIEVDTIVQCFNDNQCFREDGSNLCQDENKPCKCVQGRCKTFNPCENNPCLVNEDLHKTSCSPTDKKPYYQCECSENYINVNGECKFNCNEYGTVNTQNNGCDCIAKYKFRDNNCYFDCDNIEHSHTNEANDACDCDFGYKFIGNECIFNCDNIPHSHPNEENNDCVCDENYFPSSNFCCQANSTYNAQTKQCECNDGFHLEGDFCVEDTVCTNNPCLHENEKCVEDENETNGYRCICEEEYHRSGNLCCPKYYSSNNLSGNEEECVPDYIFCNDDGDCTDGQLCTIHKTNDDILTYCTPPLPQAEKISSEYCTNDEDCYSGTCIKYADSDNDPANGYDGYCAKLCTPSNEITPCENVTCGNGGNCIVNDIYYIPECNCPQGYRKMGTKCLDIDFGQGNLCGNAPELIIDSSGVYQTSNKISDGYTDNYRASCKPGSSNNESVFKLILNKDSVVFVRTLTNLDTVIYLKETCDGEDIVCNDDISETVFRSQFRTELNKGIYYLFIDSMAGDIDLDKEIEFVVKIIPKSKCLRGTECTLENLDIDGTLKQFNVCKPQEINNTLITKCYKDEDCKEGMVCSFDPLAEPLTHKKTIGCIPAPQNCTESFDIRFDAGGDCCSNYYQTEDDTDICGAFCSTTTDCPVGYFCEPFTIKDLQGNIIYTSALDSVNNCEAKPKICDTDYDCGGTKPYCSIKDNGDGRLYRACENRSGFNKNIGANCNVAGYNNCYNYACLIEGQGINQDNGNAAYCTAPCIYDSNCPEGYSCKEATIIYPENDDTTKTCKRTVDSGCISYEMKVCVKN